MLLLAKIQAPVNQRWIFIVSIGLEIVTGQIFNNSARGETLLFTPVEDTHACIPAVSTLNPSSTN